MSNNTGQRTSSRRSNGRRSAAARPVSPAFHILFGSLERLLEDLATVGAPDRGTVRAARLSRRQMGEFGGTTFHGVAVTARRDDEILSAWIVVARETLDPSGRPFDEAHHAEAIARWQDIYERIAALIAEKGYTVVDGVYLLPDACFDLGATCAAVRRPADPSPTAQ